MTHRHRFMGSMILVLVILILLVQWKPAKRESARHQEIDFGGERTNTLELPPSTTHRIIEPTPSRPVTPIPVPDDEIIEDPVELPDAELNLDEALESSQPSSQGEGDRVPVADPEQPARIVQIVEPSRSSVPEEYRGRVVVDVRLLIGPDGTVEEARLLRISAGDEETLSVESEPWLNSVLDAAFQWQFRAAEDENRAVWSETTIQFHL
ncbi:MAG: hypothetical protein ACQER4_03130 [Bacteroidota bacterium]